MDTELELELFKSIGQEFSSFINNSENNKVLFSGKYGAGKTTFLRTFFEIPIAIGVGEQDFEVFHISPINYSVASNEDIIDLIKFDIILEFLQRPHLNILTSDIPSYQLLSEKDIAVIFTMLLSQISIKGLQLDKIFDGLKQLKSNLDERKSSLDQGDQFIAFLERIENRAGIFERDIVTKLIENVLERTANNGKAPVLIIDDFDRMDPDHIFRVLNIFSAHFDNETIYKRGQRNKFGFDKVIIVCDHRNLESLFHTRYGKEADFSGYIDKFYNRVVFDFDIKKVVRNYLQKVLFKMDDNLVKQYKNELYYFGRQQDDLFEQIIMAAVLRGDLTLRRLRKLEGVNVENQYRRLSMAINSRFRTEYSLFLLTLCLFLFGDAKRLFTEVERLFDAQVPLGIDNYSLNLFISIERTLDRNQSEREVKIITALATYTFSLESGGWTRTNTQVFPGEKSHTGREQTLDLIKYFMKRIEQIANN